MAGEVICPRCFVDGLAGVRVAEAWIVVVKRQQQEIERLKALLNDGEVSS